MFGTRRLIDVLRDRHAAAQAHRQIKTEAASIRGWGRSWVASRQLNQETGLSPAALSPVGFSYQRARFGRPNLRPQNAIPTLAREAEAEERRGFLSTLRQRNKEAQQRGLSELASGGPYSDEDTAALRAISDSARENRVTGKEFLDYIRRVKRIPDETDNPNILTPEGRTAQGANRLLNQYLEMKQRAQEGQGGLTEYARGNAGGLGFGDIASGLRKGVGFGLDVAEKEVNLFRPVTEPLGRAFARGLPAIGPALGPVGTVAGLGAAIFPEQAEEIGEEAAAQTLVPSNILPPFGVVGTKPLLRTGARLLGRGRLAEEAVEQGSRGARLASEAIREAPPPVRPRVEPDVLSPPRPTVGEPPLPLAAEVGAVPEGASRVQPSPLPAARARELRQVQEEVALHQEVLTDPASRKTRGLIGQTRQRIEELRAQADLIAESDNKSKARVAAELDELWQETWEAQQYRLGTQESMAGGLNYEKQLDEFGRVNRARSRPTPMGGLSSDDLKAQLAAIDEVRGRLNLPDHAVPQMGERPPPQFGTTQREFLGEQGGRQSRMFTPEETGQRGQVGLEDMPSPAAAEALPEGAGARGAGGGAALTQEQLGQIGTGGRQAGNLFTRTVQSARDAISSSRPGREAWRDFSGALAEGETQRSVWRLDMRKLAQQNKLNLRHGPQLPWNRQSNQGIGMVEQMLGEAERSRGIVANFPTKQQPFIQSLYSRLDEITDWGKANIAGFEDAMWEDGYVPWLFKPAKGRGRLFKPTTAAPGGGFLRGRESQGTLGEILARRPDLDLVTWDPVEIVALHERAVQRLAAKQEIVRMAKAAQLIRTPKTAEAGWVDISDIFPELRSKTVLREATDTAEASLAHTPPLLAEPKFAQVMGHAFGRSGLRQHAATSGLLRIVEAAKLVKVFGGGFQFIDETLRPLLSGVGEAAVETLKGRPLFALRQLGRGAAVGPRALVRALVPGADDYFLRQSAGDRLLQAARKTGGARFGIDPSISDVAVEQLGLGRYIPIPGVKQLVNYVSSGAYGRFLTEVQEGYTKMVIQRHLRAGLSLEKAAIRGVEEAQVGTSTIPAWQSLVQSPTGRDLLRLLWFAAGEVEAWARIPVQAPRLMFGGLVSFAVAAEMINKATTGHWLSEDQLKPWGDDGWTYNTNFLRPELPWKGPDGRTLYLDLLGQMDTPFRWALDPKFATQTRLGQLPRAVIDTTTALAGGKPPFGEKVESPEDWATFAAQQVSPIPVSGLAGTEKGRIGYLGAGIQAGGLNVSAERKRDLVQRKLEEKGLVEGQDFTQAELYNVARNYPELAEIVGTSEGVEARNAAIAEEEQGLLRYAKGALRGDTQAGAAFRDKIADFYKVRHGATLDQFADRKFPDPKDQIDKAIQAYRDLDPADFPQPDNQYETDWDAYEAEQKRLMAKLPAEIRKALERPPDVADETLQRAIKLYEKAKEDRDALADISPVRGLSAPYYDRIRDLQRQAKAWRIENPKPNGEWPPLRYAIKLIAERQGLPERLWKDAVHYGSIDLKQRNPAYVAFLRQHESGPLGVFYPELYDTEWYSILKRRAP